MSIRQGIHSMSPPSSLHGGSRVYKRTGSTGSNLDVSSSARVGRISRSGTVQMSQHIDQQRHQIAELERELYWVETESESLRKQIANLQVADTSVATLEDERSKQSDLLQANTDELVAFCSRGILEDSAPLDLSHLKRGEAGYLSVSHSVICAAILDGPKPGSSIAEHLEKYERGLNMLLNRPADSIRIVYVCGDEFDDRSLRVFYSIDIPAQEILLKRIQDFLAGSYNPRHTDSSFMLTATKSIVLDVDMVIDNSTKKCQSNQNSMFHDRPISDVHSGAVSQRINVESPKTDRFKFQVPTPSAKPVCVTVNELKSDTISDSFVPSAMYYGQATVHVNSGQMAALINTQSPAPSSWKSREPTPLVKSIIPPLNLQKADTPSDHSVGIEAIPTRPSWGRRASRSDICIPNYLQAFPRNS